jgi:hypothetical protein
VMTRTLVLMEDEGWSIAQTASPGGNPPVDTGPHPSIRMRISDLF